MLYLSSGNTWAKPSAFSMDCAAVLILRIAQYGGIEDVRAHAQLLGSFLGDGDLVAGNHLDFHAHLPGARNGCLGLLARRIEQRQHAENCHLPS